MTLIFLWRALVIAFGCAAAGIDIKTKKIPNALILAMLASWAATIAPALILDAGTAAALLRDSAAGLAAGGAVFVSVYIVSRRGLGGGDVKFMAAAGLYIGFPGTLSAMLYGTALAALTGVLLLLLKKAGPKDAIPLAPFLCAGIIIAVMTGS